MGCQAVPSLFVITSWLIIPQDLSTLNVHLAASVD
jgi:hypothetical protein